MNLHNILTAIAEAVAPVICVGLLCLLCYVYALLDGERRP